VANASLGDLTDWLEYIETQKTSLGPDGTQYDDLDVIKRIQTVKAEIARSEKAERIVSGPCSHTTELGSRHCASPGFCGGYRDAHYCYRNAFHCFQHHYHPM